MNDKDRTLKALEDMKESMAYAVRRRATADVVSLEAQVLALQTQLERVERALQNFIDIDDDCGLMVDGNAGSELVVALSKAREALPSAKTAQTEQQNG